MYQVLCYFIDAPVNNYKVGQKYKFVQWAKLNPYHCYQYANDNQTCLYQVLAYFTDDEYNKMRNTIDIDSTSIAITNFVIMDRFFRYNLPSDSEKWFETRNNLNLLKLNKINIITAADRVCTDSKQNLMDDQGNILSKEWFCRIYPFSEGFARVQKTNLLWNFIDEHGNQLSNIDFQNACDFNNGEALVIQKGDYSKTWYKINKNGTMINIFDSFDQK